MSPDLKFCSRCGASNPRDQKFCNRCGARMRDWPSSEPPAAPAAGSAPHPAAEKEKKTAPPRTLPTLLLMILSGMVHNIRGMVKGMIKGMIMGFLLVLLLNTFLQVTSLSQNDIANSVIAAAGLSSSPNSLLFWFLFTAILAFFWSQAISQGLKKTFAKCTSMPRWIGSSATTAGSTAFPLIMAGIAAALIVRLLLLTNATGIQFLIIMFGILFSQQESLAILAMSLGWSDLSRLIKRSEPVIPAPGFPAMGVLGAFCGFLAALFVADNLVVITIVVILMVAGTAVVWFRRRTASAGPASAAGTTRPGGRGP